MFRLLEKHKVPLVYFPLVVYWIILIVLTSIPLDTMPKVGISDKFNHFAAYLVLSILLYLALSFQDKFPALKTYSFIFTILIASFYGALDEIHQAFIPGRLAEWFDWLADIAGSIMGTTIIHFIRKRYNPVKKS